MTFLSPSQIHTYSDLDARIDALEDAAAGAEPIAAAHIADTTNAHAAPAIGFTPTGTVASTTVQAAVAEVSGDVETHKGLAAAAHAGTAVSFAPTGTIAATTVQAAVAEVATDAASALTTHDADTTSVHGITNTAQLVAGDGTVLRVVKLTQAAYDGLTPVATTLYVIVG